MPDTFLLWETGAPGAVGTEPEDCPSLTVYPATGPEATGASIVVCPGGGYAGLAPHEAEPIALWLNSVGVAAGVLKYRLGPRYHHPAPWHDASRAVRTMRARATEWGFDGERVGILGFSAGGHLSSTVGTHYDAGNPASDDPVERARSRPDLMVLIYPVISLHERPHVGSTENLLGKPPSDDLIRVLSNEDQVTRDTPPAFLVHGMDDAGVPVEHSTLFAEALHRNGVPVEAHLFEHGPHGFGLGGDDPQLSMWPTLCAHWLRSHAF
jgi:acetyl esterase/lipase